MRSESWCHFDVSSDLLSSWSCQLYYVQHPPNSTSSTMGKHERNALNCLVSSKGCTDAWNGGQDLASTPSLWKQTSILWTYHFFSNMKNTRRRAYAYSSLSENKHLSRKPTRNKVQLQMKGDSWRISMPMLVGSAFSWFVDFIGKISREHLSFNRSNINNAEGTSFFTD